MVPCEAARMPSAPYSASTMHCEVSTLPAATAAGGAGSSIEPGGIMISSGSRQPSLSGIGSLHQSAEDVQHGGGAHRARGVEVVRALGGGAGEIHTRAPRVRVDVDAHGDDLTAIHLVTEPAAAQAGDGVAHAERGILLHVRM